MNKTALLTFLFASFLHGSDYTRSKPHVIISKQAADVSLIKPQKAVVLQAGAYYGLLPQQIANISAHLRNGVGKDNVVCLDFLKRSNKKSLFDLNIIIPLLCQAHKTLTAQPISPERSYVELAGKHPLAALRSYKKLLYLFIACDALNIECHRDPFDKRYEAAVNAAAFVAAHELDKNVEIFHDIVKKTYGNVQYNNDRPILKAVALRIEQLGLKKNIFDTLDRYCSKIDYNFAYFIWPHIQAQAFLNAKCKHTCVSNDISFSISIRDLLVHNALEAKITDLSIFNHALNFSYKLNLNQSRLNSLDGINDVRIWMYNYLLRQNRLSMDAVRPTDHWNTLRLANNQFTTLPDLPLPHLELLDLENNKISRLPDNLDSFPALKMLNLKGNPITHIPAKLKRKGLTILWDEPK